MLPRVEFEMSQEQLDKILKACKPTPVMYLSGGLNIGGDPQENANRAWATLGSEMGFDPMSVRPIPGKGQRFFSAIPSETKEARFERLTREAEERKAAEIASVERQIVELQEKLSKLKG